MLRVWASLGFIPTLYNRSKVAAHSRRCTCADRDLHLYGRAQKKAQIRYHPDRHHAGGMTAQVEAEELFKIVSEAPLPRIAKFAATRHPGPPQRY